MKIKNKEGEIDKIDFLNYYLTFNYDGKREEEFSIIDSKLSLKKPHGGEYLFIHMQHEVYDESSGSQNAKPYKFPKLEISLTHSDNFAIAIAVALDSLD